jgi:hypothetical protein
VFLAFSRPVSLPLVLSFQGAFVEMVESLSAAPVAISVATLALRQPDTVLGDELDARGFEGLPHLGDRLRRETNRRVGRI